MQYIEIPEQRYCCEKLTFKRIKPTSDYIRILKVCSDGPKTLREIYPNVAKSTAPMAQEVVALAKLGYLAKFSTPNHIHQHTWQCRNGVIVTYNTYSKVWYGATSKASTLLSAVE